MERPPTTSRADESTQGPISIGPRTRAPAWRLLFSLAAAGSGVFLTAPAQAQTGVEAASTSGKGIAAGILLGAETVVFAEAALGVRPRWAYLVGAGVGAVGGGVGGYFLEDSLSPKTAMFLLAGGMVLAIPATVAALSASAYSPPADYIQDRPPVDEPVEDPPRPGEVSRAQERLPRLSLRPRPPAFVGMDEGKWSLGVPAVAVLDVYSAEMRRAYNLSRETEVRVPLLSLYF